MKTVLSTLALAMVLSGCASKIVYSKLGATQEDYNRDTAQCDYETSASAGEGGLFTPLGDELDRMGRKRNLMAKCMTARGWTAQSSR